MINPELGDKVQMVNWGGSIPMGIEGEVIKVNATTCRVRWNNTRAGRVINALYRGRTRQVPEISLVNHRSILLVERKGGPW